MKHIALFKVLIVKITIEYRFKTTGCNIIVQVTIKYLSKKPSEWCFCQLIEAKLGKARLKKTTLQPDDI